MRLIGQANETQVKIEDQKFTALIDSGAQISQLTESLVKALGLKMKHLKELLPLDGAGGIDVSRLSFLGSGRTLNQRLDFSYSINLLITFDVE